MRLYLLSQDENTDYDTYDSAVVVACSREEAQGIHPSSDDYEWDYEVNKWRYTYGNKSFVSTRYPGRWVSHIKNVEVKEIGEAGDDISKGVVCASFNAG
jgi:hypothetical protein